MSRPQWFYKPAPPLSHSCYHLLVQIFTPAAARAGMHTRSPAGIHRRGRSFTLRQPFCFSVPPCRFPWGKNHARRRPRGLTPYSPKLSRPRGRVLQAFGLSCAHTGAWRARARAPKAPACGVQVRPPAARQRGARVCASRRDCPVPTRLGRGKFTCVFFDGGSIPNAQRPAPALGIGQR